MISTDKIKQYSNNLNVLFIDSDSVAREGIEPLLGDLFASYSFETDINEGLNRYLEKKDTKEHFHLIITDVILPDFDMDRLGAIKENNNTTDILIFSSNKETKNILQSIKLGICDYIFKPLNSEEFMQTAYKISKKMSEQLELKEKYNLLEQYKDIVDKTTIISKTNLRGVITYVNDKFCDISGYAEDELLGQSHNIVRDTLTHKSVYEELWQTIKQEKKTWQGTIRNKNKDGELYYVQSCIRPIKNIYGEVVEYIAAREDVTNILNPKKQLTDYIDAHSETFVVMLKVEEYDSIEKLYGHKKASLMEQRLSEIFFKSIPDDFNFSRIYNIGNGEYVFVADSDTLKMSDTLVKEKLVEFQHKINNMELESELLDSHISLLIDVAHGQNVLEDAKIGLERLQETKKSFMVADGLSKIAQNEVQKNIETINMIRTAIENNKIVSYFQPIIDNKTKEIVKYESLVRLIDERANVLSPFFFLDVAKQTKYYDVITHIVLENSLQAFEKTDKEISINLSIIDIEKYATRSFILSMLEKYKEHTNCVVFELLEDENIKDFDITAQFIKDIKSYGVQVAIDDFGAGYSSFERILDYQPDILKIDGSLIKNIQESSFSLSIVEAIALFAKKNNIKVIAEFVENREIYDILCELNIQYSQGYYFGKPEPIEALTSAL